MGLRGTYDTVTYATVTYLSTQGKAEHLR
jgi:hypothetical protein